MDVFIPIVFGALIGYVYAKGPKNIINKLFGRK